MLIRRQKRISQGSWLNVWNLLDYLGLKCVPFCISFLYGFFFLSVWHNWSEFAMWHCISLMLNFLDLWSGDPATNQSHLIIHCQDVSYWPSFSLSKHCKTLSRRHTTKCTHIHILLTLCGAQLQISPLFTQQMINSSKINFKKAKGQASFLKGLFSLLSPSFCWAVWGYWFGSAVVWWDKMTTRRSNLVY